MGIARIVPGQASPAGGRGAMRTGTSIFLIAVGGILALALRTHSPHWLNWHIAGVILILAGALSLLLPRRARTPRDRFRRWVLPRLPRADAGPRPGEGQAVYHGRQALVQESGVSAEPPTLADRVLRYEDDPPL